jgi:adenylate kinase
MIVILLGPPGSGKGTQADKLKKILNIPHISTGDMLREAIKKGSPVGEKAKKHMQSGGLVPDDVIMELIQQRITEADCKPGFILDGFPRTINQASALEALLKEKSLKIDKVVNMDVDDNIVIERISGRRTCRGCGTNYHVKYNSPAKENVCDKCAKELYQRDDDKIETIKQRLVVYREQTYALLDYYKKIVVSIKADKGIDRITDSLAALVTSK